MDIPVHQSNQVAINSGLIRCRLTDTLFLAVEVGLVAERGTLKALHLLPLLLNYSYSSLTPLLNIVINLLLIRTKYKLIFLNSSDIIPLTRAH